MCCSKLEKEREQVFCVRAFKFPYEADQLSWLAREITSSRIGKLKIGWLNSCFPTSLKTDIAKLYLANILYFCKKKITKRTTGEKGKKHK